MKTCKGLAFVLPQYIKGFTKQLCSSKAFTADLQNRQRKSQFIDAATLLASTSESFHGNSFEVNAG